MPESASAAGAPEQRLISVRLPTGRPVVTYSILGLTLVVFVLQFLSGVLFKVDLPVAFGAKINQAIAQGQIWRLITPVLLHGSVLHIGFNMYALIIIGREIERYYGHWRFLTLYLLGAFTGNVASFLMSQTSSLGASTAIFGLVAAEGVFIYRNRFLFGRNARAMLINIAGVVVVNLILGLNPGIDNWGHLGGLIGGVAFAWLAGPAFRIGGLAPDYKLIDQTTPARAWQAAAGLGLIFALAATAVIFFR